MSDRRDNVEDDRPLRLVPALVAVHDRYGDPFWLLGIELWTNLIVLRYAGIERELHMEHHPGKWFRLRDDTGTTYRPGGGSSSGGQVGDPLSHQRRFSGNVDFRPGLTYGATRLTVEFSERIAAGPIDIDVA
jgi:hypothetical protein